MTILQEFYIFPQKDVIIYTLNIITFIKKKRKKRKRLFVPANTRA